MLHSPLDALILRCETMMFEGAKRGKDRPNITWKKVILIDLEYAGIEADLAKDSKQWKLKIHICDTN